MNGTRTTVRTRSIRKKSTVGSHASSGVRKSWNKYDIRTCLVTIIGSESLCHASNQAKASSRVLKTGNSRPEKIFKVSQNCRRKLPAPVRVVLQMKVCRRPKAHLNGGHLVSAMDANRLQGAFDGL